MSTSLADPESAVAIWGQIYNVLDSRFQNETSAENF